MHVDQHALAFLPGQHDDRALRAGRFRRILQEVGQDTVHHVRRRMRAGTAVVQPQLIRHPGMHRAQQRDAFGDDRVDVEDLGMDQRLARELGEGPHPPLERFDLADHDLNGLVHERALGSRVPRLHLLDGEPDRRQRVLQLVRGLARQRLPAGHPRQVHQPVAVLLELIRHVVEGLDGAGRLRRGGSTRRPSSLQPSRPVATGEIGERRGQLPDRPADATGDQHQRQQRDEPCRAEQHEQRQRESTPQIPRLDRVHEPARFPDLGGQLLHADAAEIAAVDLDGRTGRRGRRRGACSRRARRSPRTRRSAPARRSPRTTGQIRATGSVSADE